MSRRVRIAAQVLGLGLIALVLWLVGWNDSVVGLDGREHRGRILERGPDFVRIETEQGLERVPVADATKARSGLRGSLVALGHNPKTALSGLALHFLALFAAFVRWHVLLAGADLKTPLRETMRLTWVGNFFATVVPGGVTAGDVIKSVYIARTHGDRKTRAVLTVWLDRIIGMVMLCVIAAAAALTAPADSRIASAQPVILAVLGISLVGVALLFWPRFAWLLEKLPFQGVVEEFRLALRVYRSRPAPLVWAGILSLVSHGFSLSAFFFYARAMDMDLSLLAVGAAIPVAQMMAAIPGLPGGWGTGELAMFFFLPAAGVPAAGAVALSITYRAAHTLLCLPGGLMLSKRELAAKG